MQDSVEPVLSQLYSTAEAAAYLGIHIQTLKSHIYVVKDLQPDKVLAGRLLFTRVTLDAFKATKRPPWGGRPLKDAVAGPIRPRPKKHEG